MASRLVRVTSADATCRRFPLATYRLQFNAAFTFDDATAIVDYLARARDLALLRLELLQGGARQHARLRRRRSDAAQSGDRRSTAATTRGSTRCAPHGMGHIIDLVPNHMGIAQVGQPVVAGRPRERPELALRAGLRHRLAPAQAGAREQGAAADPRRLVRRGARAAGDRARVRRRRVLASRYFDHAAADRAGHLRPHSRRRRRRAARGDRHRERRRASSSSASSPRSGTCPAATAQTPELLAERDREKEVIKRRLAALTRARRRAVLAHVERAVGGVQRRRTASRAASTALDALLSAQAYRLAYWRVAAEEINYRRFFDINELAAIRMEDPAVFERAHAFAFELLARGLRRRLPHRSRRRPVRSRRLPASGCRRARARCGRTLYSRRSAALPRRRKDPRASTRRCRSGRSKARPATTSWSMLNGLFVDERNERALNERLRAVHAAARALPRDRLPRQAAHPARQHGQRAERAGAPAEPLLGAEPPLPRLHAEQPEPGDARDHRVLPRLPHLRERPRAGRERARSRATSSTRSARPSGAIPNRPAAVSSTSSATCC